MVAAKTILLRSFAIAALLTAASVSARAAQNRVVIVKVDGVPARLIERYVQETDPHTGRPKLPWIKHVFEDEGSWVRNFYVRGISLSAPSWCTLDTGQHTVIHGNAEYDRYSSRVYDYLNFFPFYLNYARSRHADMPGVEVLDEAGIPLLSDAFRPEERYESMQMLQRGVRWRTLEKSLTSRFFRSPQELVNEWQTGFEMSRGISDRQEQEIIAALRDSKVLYLDYFSGEYDHVAHLTEDEQSQFAVLQRLDILIGRFWTAIQASPLAANTVLVLVSDHGMTTEAGTYSQGYNLIRFFNSPEGGGHHVLTNRYPMQMFKLRGLYPFVSQVITPSQSSFYLAGQQEQYPTAKLDLDGNERAGVQLRNSDWNLLQILFQQIARRETPEPVRNAAAIAAMTVIDRNRSRWLPETARLGEELTALKRAISGQRALIENLPKIRGKTREAGAQRQNVARSRAMLESWESSLRGYQPYLTMLEDLLQWAPGKPAPTLLPRAMGDRNTVQQLREYVVGLAPGGIVLSSDGTLDWERSFQRVNYLSRLTGLRVRNNVQEKVGPKPVDFVAVPSGHDVLVYGGEEHQLRIESRTDDSGALQLRVVPVHGAGQTECEWGPGFPLALFEDPEIQVPGDRVAWLREWHTDREWLDVVHRSRYSNAVVGLHEHFRQWKPATVPPAFQAVASPSDWPVLLRFVERERSLVANDLLVLAAEHWNFNVRNFNPGGNHGSFFRSSTHSVLMMAGGEVPRGLRIEKPYDGLSFAPTVLALTGRLPAAWPEVFPASPIEEIARSLMKSKATR